MGQVEGRSCANAVFGSSTESNIESKSHQQEHAQSANTNQNHHQQQPTSQQASISQSNSGILSHVDYGVLNNQDQSSTPLSNTEVSTALKKLQDASIKLMKLHLEQDEFLKNDKFLHKDGEEQLKIEKAKLNEQQSSQHDELLLLQLQLEILNTQSTIWQQTLVDKERRVQELHTAITNVVQKAAKLQEDLKLKESDNLKLLQEVNELKQQQVAHFEEKQREAKELEAKQKETTTLNEASMTKQSQRIKTLEQQLEDVTRQFNLNKSGYEQLDVDFQQQASTLASLKVEILTHLDQQHKYEETIQTLKREQEEWKRRSELSEQKFSLSEVQHRDKQARLLGDLAESQSQLAEAHADIANLKKERKVLVAEHQRAMVDFKRAMEDELAQQSMHPDESNPGDRQGELDILLQMDSLEAQIRDIHLAHADSIDRVVATLEKEMAEAKFANDFDNLQDAVHDDRKSDSQDENENDQQEEKPNKNKNKNKKLLKKVKQKYKRSKSSQKLQL